MYQILVYFGFYIYISLLLHLVSIAVSFFSNIYNFELHHYHNFIEFLFYQYQILEIFRKIKN